MLFGLDVSQHQLSWEQLLARARYAEESGFDGAWAFDHFRPLYGERDGPCLDGWTALAALAAATTRIRLGALVTGITYHHPSMLAMRAASVDHISNGRLEFGVGAAWNRPEHRQFGFDFPPIRERAERLEEAIEIFRLLMTRDRAHFSGKHYRLERASYRPRPVQKPHPPIWIGASGERVMLPLVARQADVWHDFGPASELRRKMALLDELAGRAKRDPKSIRRSSSLSLSKSWDRVRRDIESYAELGFEYLVVSYPSEGQARLEEFVGTVMPAYVERRSMAKS